MAYSNVGTPRFYCNVIEWLASTGAVPLPSEQFRTLPVKPVTDATGHSYDISLKGMTDNGFIAMLGHNFWNTDVYFRLLESGTPISFGGYALSGKLAPVINGAVGHNQGFLPTLSGFSIAGFHGSDDIDETWLSTGGSGISIGSIVIGTYYDMPHSPDLKLTMTRDMDGVKRTRTRGGSDLVDHKYTKSPLWGSLAPWEIGYGGNQALSRVGRRAWDLSFSYLQDSDVFGSNQSLGNWNNSGYYEPIYTETGYDPYDFQGGMTGFEYNILDDYNFYSQVIHKTNGGQLPFIFQPDESDNTFAICKFDMNSFEFKQVAKGIYNVKLKIREVW